MYTFKKKNRSLLGSNKLTGFLPVDRISPVPGTHQTVLLLYLLDTPQAGLRPQSVETAPPEETAIGTLSVDSLVTPV